MDAVSKRCSTEKRRRTIVNRRRPRYDRSSSYVSGWCMVLFYALCGTLRLVVAESSASRSNLGVARSFLRSRSASTAFVTTTHTPQENWNKRNRCLASSRNSQVMLSSTTTTSTVLSPDDKETKKAQFVSASEESLQACGERLRAGCLVSFPTETVYGLGCHALDESAIAKVFEAKRRPLTDPLIIHVNHASEAMSLWDVNVNTHLEGALRALTSKFWPGPLTLVAKANRTVVPDVVMAHTGYVACRSPSHALARQLLTCARVPIAAPSANRFGHVSPTRPTHVMDDLSSEDIWIIDPNLNMTLTNHNVVAADGEEFMTNACCDVGVESTVAKVTWEDNVGKVIVLRHGAVSEQDIRQCLKEAAMMEFEVTSMVRSTSDHVANVAPGQTIRHYSPDVLSYMISSSRIMDANHNNDNGSWSDKEMEWLQQAVVIDFGGRLKTAEPHALAYRDLSSLGNSDEAAARVFDTLRWAEGVAGAHRVYFPELEIEASSTQPHDNTNDDALILAVKDRLTRAASGIIIDTLQ